MLRPVAASGRPVALLSISHGSLFKRIFTQGRHLSCTNLRDLKLAVLEGGALKKVKLRPPGHILLCLAASAAALSSCGGEDGGGGADAASAEAEAELAKRKSTPQPLPPQTVPTAASPNGSAGEADIADNFDAATWLEPGEPPRQSIEESGAFRFTCLAGQLLYDDPIVNPGQPGVSHLHQFFGNTATDGNSTYGSLRTTGGSTCTRSDGVSPQRSAYWMPAMLDGVGNAIKPDWINTYYKQLPTTSPECAKLQNPITAAVIATGGKCVPLPNGIRFLVGYNMTTGQNDFTDPNHREYYTLYYECIAADGGPSFELSTRGRNIPTMVAAGCPSNAWLKVAGIFPSCWDGVNLDSPDHRKHIAYPVQSFCPTTHPYKFPEVAVHVHFRTDANFVAGKWSLSADQMFPDRPAGSALHFDYWEAWSPRLKDLWQKNCIDGHLSCSTGNTGDSRQIKGMQQVGPYPNHVTVPLNLIRR